MNAEQKILIERLKEAGLHTRRFNKVDKWKAAFELEWQKNPYTPEELDAEGYERWGIIGRTGLVLIDTDKEKTAEVIRDALPSTFETISPRRKLPHFYFAVTDRDVPNKYLCLKGDKEASGEIRSQNYYLVAPGTEIRYEDLETGEEKTGRYLILHDRPIAKLSYADFMRRINPHLGKTPSQKLTRQQMKEGVPKGMRHPQGIKYATLLVGGLGLDDATALQEMKRWNQLCQPPMDERDLERMVTNARGYVEGKKAETPEVFLEKLKEKAFDLTKSTWGSDTRFVTFIKRVAFPGSDSVIEKDSTVELPADMIDELEKMGLASENPWRCRKCNATFLKHPKEGICPKCNAGAGENELSPMYGLRPKRFSTIGNVLMQNYRFATPIETISESKLGLIHIYNQGHYTPIGTKGYVRRKVKQLVPTSKPALERLVLSHISIKVSMPEAMFGIKGERVVVENGILNLNEKELTPHDPNAYALTYLPVRYNPEAPPPVKFYNYLKSAIPNETDRKRVQEFCGTILVSEKVHKKGLMVVGPTDVGKSTFINIFRGIFGEENTAAQSPTTLANTRWGVAELRGKLLNATDEVFAGHLRNVTILKQVLDGDPIDAEEKFEKKFKFRPTCEHIFGCNMTPTADRRDDAFWNRWLVVEMSAVIPLDKQIRFFHKELLMEKEGILNWMIEGFERFKGNEYRFSNPQVWTDARDKWLNWGDSIQRFIQKCIVRSEDSEFKIETGRLFEIYTIFAEGAGLDVRDQKELTNEIKKLPFAQYSEGLRFEGKKRRGFKGIDVVLDTLDTLKIHSLENTLIAPELIFHKYSDFIRYVSGSMENQRFQRVQNEGKTQQKLTEVEELDEAPPKIAKNEAKTTPADAVDEGRQTFTAEPTAPAETSPTWLPCEFLVDHPRSAFIDPDTSEQIELGPFERGDTRGIPSQFAHKMAQKAIVKILKEITEQPENLGEIATLPPDIRGLPGAAAILTSISDGAPHLQYKIPQMVNVPRQVCFDTISALEEKGYVKFEDWGEKVAVKIADKGKEVVK